MTADQDALHALAGQLRSGQAVVARSTVTPSLTSPPTTPETYVKQAPLIENGGTPSLVSISSIPSRPIPSRPALTDAGPRLKGSQAQLDEARLMSKNLTRGSGGPQFRFDAPRLIPITNMIAAPHSTLPPVPSLKPKNALDAIGSALEERNSDIPPPHKRAMTKAAQNSANISGDTPVIGSRNAPQSSEGDWPKKVVMTAAASLMGSSTFSSHGPAAITTTPLMHTPPTTVKSLQASSHQAFRGPSDTAKIETGPTTSKDTAVGHSPKPLIATATANSIDKTTQSAIMTLTASEAALQELTLIVEQLTVKLEQEKLKNEQMRPKVERLERVQNEMSIISHRLEVLDEERERRRFLGTSTSMVPYTVNISCQNGFRGKVQVYPAMSGADLIRRIRCKAGVDQFASEHIAVKMGDEQLAQIATMTEQGVLQESELTVSWTA